MGWVVKIKCVKEILVVVRRLDGVVYFVRCRVFIFFDRGLISKCFVGSSNIEVGIGIFCKVVWLEIGSIGVGY